MQSRTEFSASKSVLVVDDDPTSLRVLEVSLRTEGFAVETAGDAAAASRWLAQHLPGLVIASATLADVDGFELCRRLKGQPAFATLPVMLLGDPGPANHIRAVEAGAEEFVSKPLFVKDVVGRASLLLHRQDRRRLETDDGAGHDLAGSLSDISVIDLIQTLQDHRRSGVLHLGSPQSGEGEIYFRQGAVVDAEVGRLSGRDAVFRLLSWTEGTYRLQPKNIRRKDAVGLGPTALVMEGMRRLDEWQRLVRELPSLATVFEVDYRVLAQRLAEIPDEVNGLLRLFDGERSLLNVIDDCGIPDAEALGLVGKLFGEGIIRDVQAPAEESAPPAPAAEAWLTEAAGPFRPPAPIAVDEPSDGADDAIGADADIHHRPTGPLEPLERAPADSIEPAADQGPGPPAPPVPVAAAARGSSGAIPKPRQDEAVIAIASPRATDGGDVRRTLLAAGGITDVVPMAAAGTPTAIVGSLAEVSAPNAPSPEPGLGPVDEAPPGAERSPLGVEAGEARASNHAPGDTDAAALLASAEPSPASSSAAAPEALSPSGSGRMQPDEHVSTAEALDELSLPSRHRGPLLLLGGAAVLVTAFLGGQAWLTRHLGADGGAPAPVKKAALLPAATVPSGVAVPSAPPPAEPAPPPTPPPLAAETTRERSAVTTSAPPPPVELPAANPERGTKAAVSRPAPSAEATAKAAQPTKAGPAPSTESEREASFPGLLQRCQAVFAQGKMREAAVACTAAKDANNESGDALLLLAHVEFNRNHLKEALQWAEKAIKADPNLADAYVIFGGVQQDAGRNREAKWAYKKYLELAPRGQYAADLRAIVDTL